MATIPRFYKKEIGDALVAETLRVILLTNTHVINAETQQNYADISANECSSAGTGYTALGVLLTGKTSTYTGTTNLRFTANAAVFSGVTVTPRYAAIIETNTANRKIRAQFDLGADRPCVGGSITLTWNASGILVIS